MLRVGVYAGLDLALESIMDPATVARLSALGHVVVLEAPEASFGFGGAQLVMRIERRLCGQAFGPPQGWLRGGLLRRWDSQVLVTGLSRCVTLVEGMRLWQNLPSEPTRPVTSLGGDVTVTACLDPPR